MKRILIWGSAILVLIYGIYYWANLEKVKLNHIGVLMENFGKNGKADFSLQRGRVYVGVGSELFQVPLNERRAKFDGRLELKNSENTLFFVSPRYSYTLTENRAVDLIFNNSSLAQGDDFMNALENNILEPKIFDVISEEIRKCSNDMLMSTTGSLKFEKLVEDKVRAIFAEKGVKLENLRIKIEFTERVTEKIDKKNEIETNIATIEQDILQQRKKNELEELITQQALIKSRGLTPEVLQEKFIEKWDGATPLYGNQMPVLLKNVK